MDTEWFGWDEKGAHQQLGMAGNLARFPLKIQLTLSVSTEYLPVLWIKGF